MGSQKTHDEFLKEVYELIGDEYSIISTYKKAREKINVRHNKCGNEWLVQADSFLRGTRCPVCRIKERAENRRKTNQQFLDEVREFKGDEYIFLQNYVDGNTKIEVKHKICNTIYKVKPQAFLSGHGNCPSCGEKQRRETRRNGMDWFRDKVFELSKEEYSVLDEKYLTGNTKVLIKHNNCGHVYEVSPNKFIQGRRCPNCNRPNYNKKSTKIKWKRTTEDFHKEIAEITNGEYVLVGEYKRLKSKTIIKHLSCGTEYEVTPSNFLCGKRCPNCIMSKGEETIKNILDNKKLNYETQYSFDSCKNQHKLKFDFAIKNEDKVIALIEYDGKQHFEPIDFFGGEKEFQVIQKRDRIKNNFCKRINTPLLRIPYFIEDIENFLEENLFNTYMM